MNHTLTIDGQALSIQPDQKHEFLMTTEQVALGYGVTADAIRMQKQRRGEELVEGKHYCVTDRYAPGDGQLTLWTKRGIVRLGFFIRSARARQFRDMAEDLVVGQLEQASQRLELISIRLISESTGQSRKAVFNYLAKYAQVWPVAEYRESVRNHICHLYPLTEVAAAYAARGWVLQAPFEAHKGMTQPLTRQPALRPAMDPPALIRPQEPSPLPQLLLETSQQLTRAALALLEEQ